MSKGDQSVYTDKKERKAGAIEKVHEQKGVARPEAEARWPARCAAARARAAAHWWRSPATGRTGTGSRLRRRASRTTWSSRWMRRAWQPSWTASPLSPKPDRHDTGRTAVLLLPRRTSSLD